MLKMQRRRVALSLALLAAGSRGHDVYEHGHEHRGLFDWGTVLASVYNEAEDLLTHRRLEETQPGGAAYTWIGRLETECEVEALVTGTVLADRYNSFDENTEWDTRIHNDYLTEHLGFAGWIQQGTWGSKGMTPHKQSSAMLYKRGGWAGAKNLEASNSGYWPLENQWLYMMGDSTQRQIWGSINSPLTSHEFERNAKEWTRENCAKQFPHRKKHPEGVFFPDEGWSGKCGNNEVTCHMSGFGPRGKLTFDWKHFPYEDYDEWLFGPTGLWGNSSLEPSRVPDILTFEVGLHSCFHAFNPATGQVNQTFVDWHTRDLKRLMQAVREAVNRPRPRHPDAGAGVNKTIVVVSTAGRIGNPSADLDRCTWTFNRALAHEAHQHGFAVFEREEIERRLLFKSDHNPRLKLIKAGLHLPAPSPQIIATSLAAMVGCLRRGGVKKTTSGPPMGVAP